MKSKKTQDLVPVEEALEKILKTVSPVETEIVSLPDSLKRVLAETVQSPLNIPPFNNSAMDGYAVIAADTAEASMENPIRLKVIDNVPAGGVPTQEVVPNSAARIMTGAPTPAGATAVIRFEETSEHIETEDVAEDEIVIYRAVSEGDNIRLAGEDIPEGKIVLEAGHLLRPQDIGVLASVGKGEIEVYRRPRVAVLATGDELVAVDEPVGPGQIRNSNEHTNAALVEQYGGEAVRLGIGRDNVEDLTAKIRLGLAQDVDLFLTSAGVSVGDFDMVKNVLSNEGEMEFWQVAIKPGKPLAFGLLHHPEKDREVPLLGLPGNPVAAMVAFEVFARPAIMKLGGHPSVRRRKIQATLDEEVTNSGRRHFMRGFIYLNDEDEYYVTTRDSGVRVQGSGILSSMVWANCLVVIPEEITHLPFGASVEVWPLD